MTEDEKSAIPPGLRLSPAAKWVLGCIVVALLWIISAPNSESPSKDQKQALKTSNYTNLTRSRVNDIDGQTKCAAVVSFVDSGGKSTASRIMGYINTTMREDDRRHVRDGEPGIIRKLSEEGYINVMTAAVGYCRQRPSDNLHTATIDAYEGLRELQKSMGVLGTTWERSHDFSSSTDGSASSPSNKIDVLVMRCTSLRSEGSWSSYVVVYNMTKHELAAITTDKEDGFDDPNPTTRIISGQTFLVAGAIKNIHYSAVLQSTDFDANAHLSFVASKPGSGSQKDDCEGTAE